MCGIAGFYSGKLNSDEFPALITDMLLRIRHRGPDESGYFFDERVAIGSVRLSIVDLKTGSQPLSDLQKRYWIAYNGEIYNFKELRTELKAKGHSFATESDTEVLLHSYIEWGVDAFARLNGGFAAAIYDRLKKELIVVRDRFGKRPVYYSSTPGTFVFASEMKGFANFPGASFQWDSPQLASIFTHWTPLKDQTGFQNIHQLPPASYMIVGKDGVRVKQYADLELHTEKFTGSEEEAAEIVRDKLSESVRKRLVSDVEVGVYLSGGLDSSITSLLAKRLGDTELRSFSVTFEDQSFDEDSYQKELSTHIGTKHTSLRVRHQDIARDFPDAVYHSEVPLFRTALVPLFTLSKMVREHGVKVVLTGEGSDEAFLGYDLFKESLFLERWMNGLEEQERDRILRGLYPHLKHFSNEDNLRAIKSFYNRFAQPGANKYWGHSIRFSNSRQALRFLNGNFDPEKTLDDFIAETEPRFDQMPVIAQSQWLEYQSLLPGYLLSSQGDRMALAHGVENRCPFLDPDVVRFAFSLPFEYRLKDGIEEKHILKRAFANDLPQSILNRAKQPYVAPDAVVFLGENSPDYMDSVFSIDELKKVDIVNAEFSHKFVTKLKSGDPTKIATRDNQALLLLLSLCLLDRYFVKKQHPGMLEQIKLDNIVIAVDGRALPRSEKEAAAQLVSE